MSKFLDNSGLSHLWNKIKSYLTSWKSENFGSGTYDNKGMIEISNGTELRFGSSLRFEVKNSSNARLNSVILMLNESNGSVNYVSNLSQYALVCAAGTLVNHTYLRIWVNKSVDLRYLIIGENGIKKGTVSKDTTGSTEIQVQNVGSINSPYLCLLCPIR